MSLGPQMKSKKNGPKKICVNGFIFEWKWIKQGIVGYIGLG
jgi:hypothetical protein